MQINRFKQNHQNNVNFGIKLPNLTPILKPGNPYTIREIVKGKPLENGQKTLYVILRTMMPDINIPGAAKISKNTNLNTMVGSYSVELPPMKDFLKSPVQLTRELWINLFGNRAKLPKKPKIYTFEA